VKDRVYEKVKAVFDKLPKYYMKILLREFNTNLGRDAVFKRIIGNENLHEISHNGVSIVNFATSNHLSQKCYVLHHNIHKYTWTSPDGKTHSQIDHMLRDRQRHSRILNVWSFRVADCDNAEHYLMVAKVRETLAVNKQRSHRSHMERFNLKNFNKVDVKEKCCVEL
jgi:hypothetical protein